MPRVKPVLCLGELLIDLIADEDATGLEDASSFAARPGGAPANAAVALARLGVASAFCGVVGDDPFGTRLRDTLAERGVDVSRLRCAGDAATTLAFAWKDKRGDGHFRLLRMADILVDALDVEQAGIEQLSAIVVGSVSLAADPSRNAINRAVTLATEWRVPVCFDVNIRPTLWENAESAREVCEPVLQAATVLKLSLDDARFLFDVVDAEAAFQRLAPYPASHKVLTDGGRGSWFLGVDGVEFVDPFTVEAVEPTGAGDAFTAAIVSRLIRRDWKPLERADVIFASAAGALTTTRKGAIESLPTLDEIDEFLERRTALTP